MKTNSRRFFPKLFAFLAAVIIFESFSTQGQVEAKIIVPQTKYVFDAKYYAQSNPDIVAELGNSSSKLLKHYVTKGKWEGRAAYEGAPTFQANDTIVPEANTAMNPNMVMDTVAPLVAPAEEQPVDDGIYKALFIGNSITIHPACSYWWGSWGMAATAPERDYVHQTVAGLRNIYPMVDYDIIGFSTWERDNVRSKMLPNIDGALTKDYDLVVIQVGENIKNTRNFEEDYEILVQYIKKSVPTAKVVLVGDFWQMSGRDSIKKRVADRQSCDYIDLSGIRKNGSYISSIGTRVGGDDGRTHKIFDSAVAIHPNDRTMEYIATHIVDTVINENIQNIVDEY